MPWDPVEDPIPYRDTALDLARSGQANITYSELLITSNNFTGSKKLWQIFFC